MAQASLSYDPCSYSEKLRRTIGPGMYRVGRPANDCGECARDVPADPYLRWQEWGPGFCPVGAAVDDESELYGLSYKNTKCSKDQYLPGKYNARGICTASGTGAGCAVPTEEPRLTNPPCTLRGTGWNRWEWLCWNPQERAIQEFAWNTNQSLVFKDNHRPCVELPQDQSAFYPKAVPTQPTDWIALAQARCQAQPGTVSPLNPIGCGSIPKL